MGVHDARPIPGSLDRWQGQPRKSYFVMRNTGPWRVVGVGAASLFLMVALASSTWHLFQSRWGRRRVPITILSGFLGAGKTTLLARLLRVSGGLRIAVLVNDLAEVNVDARLLQEKGQDSSMVAFSQLENGCLCCSVEADLVGAVIELLNDGDSIDHLVIECSGMAQPSSLLELFAKAEEEHNFFAEHAVLNQMVTVVDARTLLNWLDVANGTLSASVGDDVGVLSELLVEQIECADLVILSKVDCLLQAQVANCRAAIKVLNPDARLECASFGDISSAVIFGTLNEGGLTSHRKRKFTNHYHGHNNHGEDHNHHNHEGHVQEQYVPHVRSFVYESSCPFHPKRLADLLKNLRMQLKASSRKGSMGITKSLGRGLLRAKGLTWLATDMETSREWAQVGENLHIHKGDAWKQEWTSVDTGRTDASKNKDPYGDRRQEVDLGNIARSLGGNLEGGQESILPVVLVSFLHDTSASTFEECLATLCLMYRCLGEAHVDHHHCIVFIGTKEMEEESIRDALNSCLLTPMEMKGGPNAWRDLPDPIVTTPTASRHRPVTHGVSCTCCNPELKVIDEMMSRNMM